MTTFQYLNAIDFQEAERRYVGGLQTYPSCKRCTDPAEIFFEVIAMSIM